MNPGFAWLGTIAKDALQIRITLVSDPYELLGERMGLLDICGRFQ